MRPTSRLSIAALVVGMTIFVASQPLRASGLLVADGGMGGKLEIVEHDVRVTINNGIAVTHINQVFLNTENRIVEALYTFPVPNGASVSNFSMIIDGKEMIGEVVEKKRAREIYESYKVKKRDPGLLEQVDYKTFELRVFPIAAGAEQRMSITYYQQLNFDHNQATYVYPLATTTQGPIDSTTTGKFAFTIDVKSEIPIQKLFTPSHPDDFVVINPKEEYARGSLEVTEGDLSRDVVVTYDIERPTTGMDLVTSKTPGDDGYFMLSMTAGKELEEVASGMDYMFVVDISGSMANDGKLGLSRNAVNSFVDALGREDRFDVMTFNSAPNLKFGSLQSVDEDSQRASREFLLEQRARGGTELRPAILTACRYKDADRPLNVVVLSDGMTEVSEQSQLLAAINEAPPGVRVFCIGIGNDINRPLLKQVAENAGGLAAFISHQDDFQRQAQAFRRKLMRPVATNVRIEVDGVDAFDIANDQIPDLYFGSPVWLIGRYRSPGAGKVTISAEVLGQPFQETVDFDFPKTNDANPEIERMWAYEKVSVLMNKIRSGGKASVDVAEIVRLCEGYSIVSEYASFIVLENDAEYARWSIARRNATRIQRDRKAQEEFRAELERMRTESLAQIGPVPQKLVSKNSSGPNAAPKNAQPQNPGASVPTTSRPGDLDLGPVRSSPRSGGGAIDPITGLIAAGLAGSSALAARRKKRACARQTEQER